MPLPLAELPGATFGSQSLKSSSAGRRNGQFAVVGVPGGRTPCAGLVAAQLPDPVNGCAAVVGMAGTAPSRSTLTR